MALLFSPFAVANYESGLGMVLFAGGQAPRPFARFGATVSLLDRFSDPHHYVDLGLGGYAGVGLQLTAHVNLSIAVNAANPVVHNWLDEGYAYFLTTTALLEFHGDGRRRRSPRILAPAETPVIRRIQD